MILWNPEVQGVLEVWKHPQKLLQQRSGLCGGAQIAGSAGVEGTTAAQELLCFCKVDDINKLR